jgi:acetate---CoA ligase (ADP-forming)
VPSPANPNAFVDRVPTETLSRFLNPKSVAVVGASEASPRYAVRALLASPLEVHLVNPHRSHVFGVATTPDVESIAGPLDAVLTLVNSRAAVDAVRAAAAKGAAGVAVNAAGFAEIGPSGAALQGELVAAAGGAMAVLGPNCNGFVNARSGAFLAGAPELPLRAGSIGMVTHSGGFITDVAVAAFDRRVGFSKLVSTGNEAVTDLTDYFSYLVDDPDTRVICLIVERIARPRAFFEAADRALRAGKPVLALKLGRSSRGREVAKSHTGSIVGESWVYDAAFRQYGIQTVLDLAELLDRAMLFDQLPADKWSPVEGLGIVSVSGGAAALASDVCEQEGLTLPRLESLRPRVNAVLPSASVMNPLDLTGFVMSRPHDVRAILDAYLESSEVDAIATMWTLGLSSRGFADALLLPFAEAAAKTLKPMVLSMTADGRISDWADDLAASGVALSPSLRSTMRALAAMGEFARSRRAPHRPGFEEVPAPRGLRVEDVVQTPDGAMLRFEAAMALLRSFGVPVAPFAIVSSEAVLEEVDLAHLRSPASYVVKLADCAHRTELAAVRLGVPFADLDEAVAELRHLARTHELGQDIVVQPMLEHAGEAFVGADAGSDLGPVLVCGIGGVDVEALGQVRGRIVPLTEYDAEQLLQEIDNMGLFRGTRGRRAWDRDALLAVLSSASDLVAATASWLISLDVNPLVHTADGFVAVDAAAFVRTVATRSADDPC